MLKLARLSHVEWADITFGEYVPFAIEWPAHHSANVRYWRISNDFEMLMIGVDPITGALASIENPSCLRVVHTRGGLWSAKALREGHPEFDLGSFPTEEIYFDAPDVTTFEFRHSAQSIKLIWGREVAIVADGRCRLGFDAADNLVAIGLDELTVEEARIVDKVMAYDAANRGRPAHP